jgi:uncharacterized protein YdhG (YjbR/CyaY superfamily)
MKIEVTTANSGQLDQGENRMNPVDAFVESYEGEKREWLRLFVDHMRTHYPQATEVISYQIPTFKLNKIYIAFSVAKTHFSFHTLDFEVIEGLKVRLPEAKFGKGCAKVKYSDQEAIPILLETCAIIMERSQMK